MSQSPDPQRAAPELESPPSPTSDGHHRLLRIAGRTALAVVALAALAVLLPWLGVWYVRYVPRRVERIAILGVLHSARWLYLAVLVLGPLGVIFGVVGILSARSRRRPWHVYGRLLILSATLVLMIAPAEFVAARWINHLHRIPDLPTRFEPTLTAPTARGDSDAISLVVIGGSTAEGQPYHPTLSMGQIVGWQLEQVFPGRTVVVDNKATGGICLEQAVLTLAGLKTRPDAVLICAGHNEFQARYGWSRNVAYYADQGPLANRTAFAEWLTLISSVEALISMSIDSNSLDQAPPPRVTRALVDGPAFTAREYAFLLEDYGRRLDVALTFCREVGAVPIVVLPASNLADYPPARSYLRPEATDEDRDAFARDFQTARDLEESDPAAARIAYRRLLDREPTFAEAHFRFGRLLEEAEDFERALHHFRRARDLDGMPMRCPSDFEAVCREVAAQHDALLVDGPEVLASISPNGILGDDIFHDAHHPSLRGYVALSQKVLEGLAARQELGWPEESPMPVVDAASTADHFSIDSSVWMNVCFRTASFYERTAYMRYDPTIHLEQARRYTEAANRFARGEPPEVLEIPALSITPD